MTTGFVLGFRFQNGVGNGLLALVIVLLFALSMCWIWVWLGLTLKTAQGVQGVAFLVMFPLTFGSNVFVQTEHPAGFPAGLRQREPGQVPGRHDARP